MNKKRIKKYLVITLMLVEVVTLSLTYKSFLNKDIFKENNNTKVNNKRFAIYTENDEGDYVKYNEEIFPSSSYTFNESESYCIDQFGNIVETKLSYNNGKVTVISNKTIYCFMYFDKNKYDIDTDILVEQNNGTYKAVNETPGYGYIFSSYSCKNNEGITNVLFDSNTYEYSFESSTKNTCKFYFKKLLPDIKIRIYINNNEVEEIGNGTYTLNISKSNCSNGTSYIESTITYDDSTKEYEIEVSENSTCYIYLEG